LIIDIIDITLLRHILAIILPEAIN
jgi:hypothetical protein